MIRRNCSRRLLGNGVTGRGPIHVDTLPQLDPAVLGAVSIPDDPARHAVEPGQFSLRTPITVSPRNDERIGNDILGMLSADPTRRVREDVVGMCAPHPLRPLTVVDIHVYGLNPHRLLLTRVYGRHARPCNGNPGAVCSVFKCGSRRRRRRRGRGPCRPADHRRWPSPICGHVRTVPQRPCG